MEAKGCEDQYEHLQANIIYVVTNIPGPGIDLDEFESEFTCGCNCKQKCVENCSCSRFFLNYVDGCILNEKLCGPIVECNQYCKCDINCGNKLVQHGPLDCLKVTPTESNGNGLQTTKTIKKGQFICEYAGEVIGLEEAKSRIEANKRENSMNYVLVVSEHLNDRIIKTCIDPKLFGNIGRYCNHSCEPNSSLVPIRIEGIVPRLCLFASRDIKQWEEITFNYGGEESNSVHNLSDTPCLCGSSKCIRYLPHHPI
ncbi:histone-lysine N-methyltransferase SETMAR [Athalia rosae]|uniref:histone-lysine N-methyltransferase SETMAR n=1 Tax=Athalia rosae TaxID=37344 RepID=UPI002033224F|nr:histone-lysine N-methyltransferase SETMAR [Athalia rosae]